MRNRPYLSKDEWLDLLNLYKVMGIIAFLVILLVFGLIEITEVIIR